MKQIQDLVDAMQKEIDTANCYYNRAVSVREEYPTLANTYIDIASQELNHSDKFHTMAINLISKQKALGKPVPESMQAVWDYLHQKIIEQYDEIKYKISKFTLS